MSETDKGHRQHRSSSSNSSSTSSHHSSSGSGSSSSSHRRADDAEKDELLELQSVIIPAEEPDHTKHYQTVLPDKAYESHRLLENLARQYVALKYFL